MEDPEVQVDQPDVQLEVQPEEQHDELDKEMEEISTETNDKPVNESKRKDESLTMKVNKFMKKTKLFRKRTGESSLSLDETTACKQGKITWQELEESDDDAEEMNAITEKLNTTQIIQITRDSDIPVRGTPGAAGFDLRALRGLKLQPRQITKVPLKIQMALPARLSMMITGRSGLATKGFLAHAGIVDPDYRGMLCALLYNSNKEAFQIQKGQRVAQGILLPVVSVKWERTDILPETVRQEQGFGSTGI